mgnify:CR=1 FL=1
MKNISISQLSNAELWNQTAQLAIEIRNKEVLFLDHLREIERRELHKLRGYGSLHEYLVDELKYSDGSAHRRIKSMQLVRDLPEVKRKLETGELSLSAASRVQVFFNQQFQEDKTYSLEEKKDLLELVQGKSYRETETILAVKSGGELPKPDRVKPLSEEKVELRLTISKECMEQLDVLRDLLAHQLSGGGYGEVLEMITQLAVQKLDPAQKKTRAPQKQEEKTPEIASTASAPKLIENSRYIPSTVKKQLWLHAQGHCQYRDPLTGHRCTSKFALQVDHRLPFARNGSNALENLQLLCSSHHRSKTIRDFGAKKISSYWNYF